MIPRYTQQIHLSDLIKMFFVKKIRFSENYLFFNSGRSIIKWLTSELSFFYGKKLKIGIPCYVCYTVYQGLYESGNDIILLDIDPVTFTFDEKLTEIIKELDILIWINYFGLKYVDILRIIRSKFPNLIIIEDCSQVDLRDYSLLINKKSCSDYDIFSFNFRKPITTGKGGLLIIKNLNSEINMNLTDNYKKLSEEKLSLRKILHMIVYNFSYNYLIFSIVNNLISNRRNRKFIPEEAPVEVAKINSTIMKLFVCVYQNGSDKMRSERQTKNYIKLQTTIKPENIYGSLCYFPLKKQFINKWEMKSKIDSFILWDNLMESYDYFGLQIKEEIFPLTFRFMKEYIFWPASVFYYKIKT